MIELFKQYVKWKILAYFLANPTTPFHIKQLGRLQNVSPASVSGAVKSFEEIAFKILSELGYTVLYDLNIAPSRHPPSKTDNRGIRINIKDEAEVEAK